MKTEYVNGSKLSLVNDGALEIVPIGVGSMLSEKHFNTNYLVIKGGTHILVDCGRTAPEALAKLGLRLTDITTILPTHAHDDHVGGIGSLCIANRYIGQPKLGKPKLTMISHAIFAKHLWRDYLALGLAGNERANKTSDGGLHFNDYFNLEMPEFVSLEYRETSIIDYQGIDIRTFCTMHTPSTAESWMDSVWSIGLLIDERVFISGDTRFDLELIRTYSGQSEVMFQDASLCRDPVHASIDDLRTLPEETRRKMHLVHYGDNFEDVPVPEFAGYAKQGVRYIFE